MRKSFTDEQFEETFWKRVDKTRTCWIWTGAIDNHGYGKTRYGGRTLGAHRIAYILIKGAILDDLPLDHLCRNRSCVNPKHLEPVTLGENVRRGVASRLQGLCAKGLHRMEGENVYIYPSTGKAKCRACRDTYRRKYWLEKHDNR